MRGFRDEDGDDREPVEIDNVVATGVSKLAVLCVIGGVEHWIPKSQITDDSEVYGAGHKGKLVITAWLAKQKGLTS